MAKQLTNRELRQLYQERFGREPVYERPRHDAGWWFWAILSTLFVLAFLAVVAVEFFLPMIRPEGIVIQPLAQRTPAALPTAAMQSPLQQPYQQLPPQQPVQQQQVAPPVVQQQPAASPQAVEQASVVAPQAPPVEAPAPLPAPTDPAFESSFEYQPDAANSPFVGCLPGRSCNPSLPGPTAALPEPGDPGFRESFVAP